MSGLQQALDAASPSALDSRTELTYPDLEDPWSFVQTNLTFKTCRYEPVNQRESDT